MASLTDWTGKGVEAPEEVAQFLKEYESLCKKHGLMVLSEGEEVSVGPLDDSLWGIRKTTAHNIDCGRL